MTFYQMQEIVKSVFPSYPLTLIKMDLNIGYKDFCSQARLPRKSYNVALTSDVTYTLHSDVDRVYAVEILNSSSLPVANLSYGIDNRILYFYDEVGGRLESLPDEIYSVTVYYFAIPTTLVNDTDTTELPSQFEYAPIEYVFAKYYRRTFDPTIGRLSIGNAQVSQQIYAGLVADAKRLSNQNGLVTHSIGQDEIFNSNWMASVSESTSLVAARTNTRIPFGTTLERPTLTINDVGYIYFDTDFDSPVWWNGTEWV